MIGLVSKAITSRILRIAIPIGAAALIGGVLWYGHSQYQKGFNQAVSEYEQRDREGAEDARNTAEEILRDSSNVDTDRLLNDTDGFRD